MRKKEPAFVGRSDELDMALALITAGTSVDVIGDRASGRSAFLNQLTLRLNDQDWSVVLLRGIASLREQPFAAMHLAGIGAPSDARGVSTLQATVSALLQATERPRTVLFIDDWDDLDETSWGVAETVRRATGLPMVRTRLRGNSARHTPSGLPAATLEPVIVVEMGPMRFEELEAVVESVLGAPVEGGTMSRLYSKSGGSVGLALSMAEVARREQRIQPDEEGRWVAVRDLWSPALSALVEAHLEGVGAAARDALETIALVGVADLDTVRKLVDWEALEQLEERSMITLVPSGSRQLVTVIPPLLVEFFRHQPVAVRRVRITDLIIDQLGTSDTIGALLSRESAIHRAPVDNDALIVRLLRERDRARRIVAGAEWTTNPSPATAVRFLSAMLHTDPADPAIAEVMTKTDIHVGELSDRAEFAVLRARWTAYIRGDVDAAVAGLERQSSGVGDWAPLLQAERVALLIEVGRGHGGSALPDLSAIEDAPAAVRIRVLEVTMLLQLARGEFAEVKRSYGRVVRTDPNGASYYARAYAGLADLALGRLDAALGSLMLGLDEARGLLDIEAVRAYSAIVVSLLVVAGDYDAVDEILDSVFAAGDPPPLPPGIQVMLLTCAAMVAIRRGNVPLGERYIGMIAGLRFTEGPLPAQSSSMASAQLLAIDDPDGAAGTLWLSAETAWATDNRFAACYGYLASLEIVFDQARFELAQGRVAEIGGGLLESRLRYLRANHARDARGLLEASAALEASGQHGLALTAARKAAMRFTEDRDAEGADRASEYEARLSEQQHPRRIHTERFSSSTHGLSEREREVARLAIEGLTNPEIASRLVVSVRTVESHIHHLLRKLDIGSRQALQFYADRL